MDDKQTVIPINRYLARYFGDKLRSEEIAKLSALYTSPEHALTIGSDAQAFQFAYSDQQVKSESSTYLSCMRYTTGYFGTPCHPAETYAAGDLSIAYITCPDDSSQVLARAIIWPKKMSFVRVYGVDETIRVALVDRLESLGYCRANDWRGARIRAVEFDGRVVVPYIDGDITSLEYDDDDDVMTVSRHGNVDGSSTRGWAHSNSGRRTCDACNERCSEDDMRHVGNELWCDDCVSNGAVFCEYSEEYFSDSERFITVETTSGSQTWHDSAARHAFHCENLDAWFANRDFDEIEVNTRNGAQTWCEQDNSDDYFVCERTGEAYACNDFESVTVWTDEFSEVWEATQAAGLIVYDKESGAAYLPDCVPEGVEVSSFPFGKVEDTRQLELI
jgi:hypothetical protein